MSKSSLVKGIIYALISIFIYILTAVIMKSMFSNKAQESGLDYNKPFFIGYSGGSSFIVYLIPFAYKFIFKAKFKWEKLALLNAKPNENIDEKDISHLKEIHMIEIKAALICFIPYFLGNTLYYYALSMSSVSSTIILQNTSTIFVYMISLGLLNDKFNFIKLVAVLLGLGGIVLIAYMDNESAGIFQSAGDLISVISAFGLALYCVLLSKQIPAIIEDKISIFHVLGYISLFVLISLWPILIVFHFTGFETFQFPTGIILLYNIINIILGTLGYDYGFGKANILGGPLLVNLLLMISLPSSILIDSIWQHIDFNFMYYIGTSLIVGGFVILTYVDYFEEDNGESLEKTSIPPQNDKNNEKKILIPLNSTSSSDLEDKNRNQSTLKKS